MAATRRGRPLGIDWTGAKYEESPRMRLNREAWSDEWKNLTQAGRDMGLNIVTVLTSSPAKVIVLREGEQISEYPVTDSLVAVGRQALEAATA